MVTFSYKAYNGNGAVVEGTAAAASRDAMIDTLYRSGLTPFEAIEVAGSVGRVEQKRHNGMKLEKSVWRREIGGGGFSAKQLKSFTVELASLAKSGLPIDEALRVIGGPGSEEKIRRLAEELLRELLAGAQLSEAMQRRPHIFPADYRAIVGAGEVGGAVSAALSSVAELLTRRLAIRAKLTSAMIYPAILIAMSLISVFVIVSVLVPSIAPIFTDAGLPLPGILGVLSLLQDNSLLLLAAVVMVAAASYLVWSGANANSAARESLDRGKLSVPFVGKFIKASQAARVSRALGTLLGAGVPIMTSMQTCRDLIENQHLRRLFNEAMKRVAEGQSLSRSFSELDLVPAAALRMVAVGEESGRLGAMLVQAAQIVETEQQRSTERILEVMTPLLTLVIGGTVGALVMSVMGAVMSVNELALQ